jgi:DNA sulfur modification protein DndD
MRLDRLDIRNFRPYLGDVTIELPERGGGELFLIHGHNGAGKTSLHMAIQWALYGEAGRRELYEHANTAARREPSFRMSVSITFRHDGHSYNLTREAVANKNAVEKPDHLDRSTLTLYRDGQPLSSGEQQVSQERVEGIVPRDASQFFFFDGEDIGRYSSSEHIDETRQAIELVLGLRAAQNARKDAASLRDEIRKKRNRALARSQDHSELVDAQQQLQSEVDKRQEVLDRDVAAVRELEERRAEHRAELESLGEVQAIAQNRDELAAQVEDVRALRSQVIDQLQKESRDLYMRVLHPKLSDALEACQVEYERARESETARLVDGAVRSYLEQLRDRGTCLCGEPLAGQHLEALEAEIARAENTGTEPTDDAGQQISGLASKLEMLRSAHSAASNAAGRFEELKVQKIDLDERLSGMETRLAEYDNQIRSIDVESVNALRDLVERLDRDISMGHRENAAAEEQLRAKRGELVDLDRKIGRLGSADVTVQAMSRQLELLERTERAFDEYLLRSARARREQIEDESNSFFRRITNKEAGYDSMFIADDFTFGLQAADGTSPNMDQISAGEKQVVAFSFIMGLNQYARAHAPLMIDTPMGRLDTIHRRNLATALARLPQQVFLFVTDTDLGFGVGEIFDEHLDAEYEIVHDQKTLSSGIREKEVVA